MKVECKIGFADLCRQLGVPGVAGASGDGGGLAQASDTITLFNVSVSDDEMTLYCERCSRCEDEIDYKPPEQHYLQDFLTAILAGDVSTARMLIPSVFQDDASVLVYEDVLRSSLLRRVA